jgi:hypothetical protein
MTIKKVQLFNTETNDIVTIRKFDKRYLIEMNAIESKTGLKTKMYQIISNDNKDPLEGAINHILDQGYRILTLE